jgi:hypothetical protein
MIEHPATEFQVASVHSICVSAMPVSLHRPGVDSCADHLSRGSYVDWNMMGINRIERFPHDLTRRGLNEPADAGET